MQVKIQDTGKLFKTTFKEWNRKDPFRQSAVIAYYAIFSIPGLMFLIITLAGYFFNSEAVNQNISMEISRTMGSEIAGQIKEILNSVGKVKSSGIGSIIGSIVLLVGATGVFIELQKTLNSIWKVKVVPQSGFIPILKARLFSFGLILAIAFLLLISLVVSTGIEAISNWMQGETSKFSSTLIKIFNFIFSLSVISMLFALMFKFLPDAKIKWKHVWLGSIVTGVLFTIGKTALAFYFGTAQPASLYGAAGSIILILLWVSYSSMIMFFGAEFTATYANMYAAKVPPSEIAKAVTPAKSKESDSI